MRTTASNATINILVCNLNILKNGINCFNGVILLENTRVDTSNFVQEGHYAPSIYPAKCKECQKMQRIIRVSVSQQSCY